MPVRAVSSPLDFVSQYDLGETKTELGETKFHTDGHILDYDRRRFGEASITIEVPKFHGIKRIDSLLAFPLDCHSQFTKVRTELTALLSRISKPKRGPYSSTMKERFGISSVPHILGLTASDIHTKIKDLKEVLNVTLSNDLADLPCRV